MTRPFAIGSFVLASWMPSAQAAPPAPPADPASVLGGPSVEDGAGAKTGGSFGEPTARQAVERTPMGAFVRIVRTLNEPSATYGETVDATPAGVALTDEQEATIRAAQREFQRKALGAMREAGLSPEEMRLLRDEKADPEDRRAVYAKVKDVAPDPSAAQEAMLAALTQEQREVVERRIELWRAERFARVRGPVLEEKARERIKQRDAERGGRRRGR